MNDLLYSIGLDITDLKTSAAAAKEQAEDVKRGFKGFKDVLEFGGVGAAVFGFFKQVIEYAENLKGPLDANTAAVKRFGNAFTEIKQTTLDWGAAVLGVLNRIGEWYGKKVSLEFYGKDQAELGERINAQMQETLAAIEKDKKQTEEIGQMRKQTAELAAKTTEELVRQLPLQQQIGKQIVELQAATEQVAAAAGDRRALAEAELAVAKARNNLEKLYGEQKKEEVRAEKEAADDREKTTAKLAKMNEEWDAEDKERDSDRYALEQEAAKQRIADAVSMQEAYNEEIAQAEELVRLQYELTEAKRDFISIKTVGQGDTEISDAQLRAKIANLESDISTRQAATFGRYSGTGGAVGYGNDPFIALEQSYLLGAKKELEAREQLHRYVSQFGEQGAARFYQADLTEFERLLEFIKASPDAKKTNQTLAEINDRLSTILPRYS